MKLRSMMSLLCLCGMAAVAPADGGTVKGKVTFKGGREALTDTQKRVVINTQADSNCTKRIGTENFVVEKAEDGSGFQNVVVSIRGLGGRGTAPTDKVILDQQGCQYLPHVVALHTGQTLLIRNSDPTNHNIHSLATRNEAFNFSQPKPGMEKELSFNQTEKFRVKCDVHPWMGCYVCVFDHPFFAVTGKDGTFAIENVPPGEYEVEFWHEELGEKTLKVKVEAGGTTAADMEFANE